jgi:hypothetical protein
VNVGLHYISCEDAVGVVVVGGRVKMRDGAIRLSNGIEIGLRNVTGEEVRTGVPLGLPLKNKKCFTKNKKIRRTR